MTMQTQSAPTAARAGDIAIIGMAGRFPGAGSVGELWSMLMAGRTGIEMVSETSQVGDSWVGRCAPLPGDVASFDAEFFGISERDAVLMDPQHRHLLDVAWEALERSGHDADAGREDVRIGVFTASSPSSYMAETLRNAHLWSPEGVDYPVLLGNDKDFTASRISYQFDLHGPAVVAQSACSSSLTCLHLARRALQAGDCDIALAGGVSVGVDRRGYRYQPGGIMSPDGQCNPFDASAQGTIRGEGAAVVVLRRLEDAERDGDRIIATVCGSAVTNDGRRKAGFTAPGVLGQSRSISSAMHEAGIDGGALGYVETHGTGTSIGDPIELRSLVAGHELTGRLPSRCPLGAIKANVGHLDAAAGITGLIKTALVLYHQAIPGQPDFSQPCASLARLQDHYVMSSLPRHRAHVDYAAVSSFGMGGTNAHVVLKAPPAVVRPQADLQAAHHFEVSARDEQSLQERLGMLAEWISERQADPEDVCTTLAQARRYPVSRGMVGTLAEFLDWCKAGGPQAADQGELTCQHRDGRRVPLPGQPRHPKRVWPLEEVATRTSLAVADPQAPSPATQPDAPEAVSTNAVLQHVAHFLQVPELSPEDDLRELGMDSIDMLQLLGELEDDFGLKVPLQSLIAKPTVATLLAECAPEPLRSEPFEMTTTRQAAPVAGVWHQVSTGTRGHLVLMHPAGGTTGCYLPLAQRSRAGWTWHAIGSVPGGGPSIREMASAYADMVIARGLTGSITIGGYSMGGNLAVEVVSQLSRRGVHVPRLLLLDSYAPETYLAPRKVGNFLEAFAMLVPTLLPQLAGASTTGEPRSVRGVLDAMTEEVGAEPIAENVTQQVEEFFQTWKGHHDALERWVPEHPVDVPITLIRATNLDNPIVGLLDIRPGDGTAWRRHTTAGLTILDTAGDHFSLVHDEDHLDALARRVDTFLAETTAQGACHA